VEDAVAGLWRRVEFFRPAAAGVTFSIKARSASHAGPKGLADLDRLPRGTCNYHPCSRTRVVIPKEIRCPGLWGDVLLYGKSAYLDETAVGAILMVTTTFPMPCAAKGSAARMQPLPTMAQPVCIPI